MRRIFFHLMLVVLMGCNDGDLQIDAINFDSITEVQSCDSPITTSSTVYFKINGKEALILTLQDGLLKNAVDTTTTILTSMVPAQSKLTYRLFSEPVTKVYFCSAIPVISPTVVDEIDAEGGEVLITTTTSDNITYKHKIELSEISFITTTDTRITDLRINNFGTVTTKVE